MGLDATFTSVSGGPYFLGITGYGQTTAYIGGFGANSTGFTVLATMAGGNSGGHLGTLIVPNGNVVVGMSSYNNDFYSKGVALHYNTLAAVTGADLTWSNSATGPSITVGSAGPYTVTVTDANGCTATSAPTTVIVNTPPAIICPTDISQPTDAGICGANVTYPDATVTGSPTPVVTYSQASGTSFGVTTTVVTATAGNICGSANCQFNVTVRDQEAPTVLTKNITIQLDALGNAGITTADVNNGSSDNCAIGSMSVTPNSFTCANVGPNTVTLTVMDVNGNPGSAPATVTVLDMIAPTVHTQNITVNLDATGHAIITPAQINAGSTDNCSIAATGYVLSKASFDCSSVGPNNVTLTVTDVNGNHADGNAIVTIKDVTPPIIVVNAPTSINAWMLLSRIIAIR